MLRSTAQEHLGLGRSWALDCVAVATAPLVVLMHCTMPTVTGGERYWTADWSGTVFLPVFESQCHCSQRHTAHAERETVSGNGRGSGGGAACQGGPVRRGARCLL